jgi:hypothetical protein
MAVLLVSVVRLKVIGTQVVRSPDRRRAWVVGQPYATLVTIYFITALVLDGHNSRLELNCYLMAVLFIYVVRPKVVGGLVVR